MLLRKGQLMISVNFEIDGDDYSTEIEYDDESEITDDLAYRILYCSQISKDCFLDAADALAPIIGLEKTQAMVKGVLEKSSTLIESRNDPSDTVIQTVFLNNDNERRNDTSD